MTDPDSIRGETIAVLGGTRPQGRGLARRFAAAGLTVVVGSRSADRAEATAAAQQAAALPLNSTVVGAFHNVSAGDGHLNSAPTA